jgi:hypothetical protein
MGIKGVNEPENKITYYQNMLQAPDTKQDHDVLFTDKNGKALIIKAPRKIGFKK